MPNISLLMLLELMNLVVSPAFPRTQLNLNQFFAAATYLIKTIKPEDILSSCFGVLYQGSRRTGHCYAFTRQFFPAQHSNAPTLMLQKRWE